MLRRSRTRTEPADVPRPDAESPATDHERFWAGADLEVAEHLDTLAGVIETDEQEAADETLEYMGTRPRPKIDRVELEALAVWADSKACRVCRRTIDATHDPATLKHDDCRKALRVARLLRRYT